MSPSDTPAPDLSRGRVVRTLRRVLLEPRLRDADVDSRRFMELQREILLEKPIMRTVFAEFFITMLAADAKWFSAEGARVELGAGASIFGDLHPDVLSTDIKHRSNLRAVVDAEAMPFRIGAVRALFGINCFHHFSDPRRFFEELITVLPTGGGCVLIEPYHGALARQFYPRVFETERFDTAQAGWLSGGGGPMTGVNQALSYIVFQRDRAQFDQHYPELELVEQRPLTNYLRYILAGGLNFRSLIPAGLASFARAIESVLAPAARWLALHHLIVLRRREVG